MKFLRYISIFFLLLNFNHVNAQDQELHKKITKNLRCLICQGQSVYDSDTEFANSLKILVKKKLTDGFDEQQIYNYLNDKYGEWILYDTKFNKNTYFLWLLPLLIFIIGGMLIFKLFNIRKN